MINNNEKASPKPSEQEQQLSQEHEQREPSPADIFMSYITNLAYACQKDCLIELSFFYKDNQFFVTGLKIPLPQKKEGETKIDYIG